MTVSECVSMADKMRPNNLTAADKYNFVSEAEAKVQKEIMLLHSPECVKYQAPGDADIELLAPAPWDMLYVHYTALMIDFTLEDYDKYNNDLAAFNEVYTAYMAHFAETFRPADGGRFPFVPVYVITQGETDSITICGLPEALVAWDLKVIQAGATKLEYDEDSENVTYSAEENTLIIEIPAEDSETLSTAALGLVSLSVTDDEGNVFKASPIGKITVREAL